MVWYAPSHVKKRSYIMKKFLSLVLALIMVLSLVACGSSNDEVVGEDTGDEVVEGGNDLGLVNEGKLTMSTNAAFPPYEMVADDGSFEGIDVEIAEAIAAKLGLELQIDDMGFDAALQAAQDGKSDIVLAGVTVTDERLSVMNFSETYANGVQVVIVKEGSEVTLDNMGDYMIGTQQGTTGYIYCSDTVENGGFGEDHVTPYDNGASAVQALINGQVDCVVIDNAPAQEFVKANPGLVILDTEFANEEYAIGMAKENTALLEAINGAIAELKEEGKLQEIIDKYIPAA